MDFSKVIIMTDLDGTLLDDKKQIAERDLAAIEEFRKGGGIFTVATGRGYAMAEKVIRRLKIDVPCVIFNGAAVYDYQQERFLWHSDMPDCSVSYLKTLHKEFPDIGIEILHEKKVYVTADNQTVEEHMAIESLTPVYCDIDSVPRGDWLKVLIAYPPEKIGRIIEFTKHSCNEGVNWVHSSPMYYEMLPQGVSKGSGYKKMLELTGRTDFFTVAAGDFGNDYEMVRTADLGVAVANAQEEVKKAAKLIVGDNNSAPMSQIIEYLKQI